MQSLGFVVSMIFYKFPSGPLATNALLLICPLTKVAAVIDPALGSISPILERADELGAKIRKILLTHTHWDHIADAHLLIQKTGAEIYVHPQDAANLEHPGSDKLPLVLPIHGVKPDHFVQDQDKVFVGKLICEVIHTPGHSPGGVCYYLREQKLLFSGDTLFQGTIGTLQLATAQPQKMWDSLAKLALLPADTHVVPGHGEDTTIGNESWLKKARQIFE